jgi:hypothetical protein
VRNPRAHAESKSSPWVLECMCGCEVRASTCLGVCACGSASIGDDVVSIASNNPDWGPADSVMYIGVLGRTASLYNLTVNVRSLTGR